MTAPVFVGHLLSSGETPSPPIALPNVFLLSPSRRLLPSGKSVAPRLCVDTGAPSRRARVASCFSVTDAEAITAYCKKWNANLCTNDYQQFLSLVQVRLFQLPPARQKASVSVSL